MYLLEKCGGDWDDQRTNCIRETCSGRKTIVAIRTSEGNEEPEALKAAGF
jgi:hypothetical protein